MSDRIIQTLPEAERRSLGLCGLTQDEQLAACNPAAVAADMQRALDYFPDVHVVFLPRLEALHRRAATLIKESPIPLAESEPEPKKELDPDLPPLRTPGAAPKPAPLADFGRDATDFGTSSKHRATPTFHASETKDHAIRNTRLFTVWIGAWITLLFPCALLGLASLLVTKFCLHINLPGDSLKMWMNTCLFIVGLYFVFMNISLCSVCHMKLFTFRHYARNRQAHRLPLLGSCLATALRIAFTMRFRCPACGTLQVLTRSSHR